ncbi:MAG: winged helix-turn-helix domain-containing protein, partial [Clostridiaceae bacterium]|nr:winged helix-turn-helix domain-containing protein [Clostridiaceae bacterium]
INSSFWQLKRLCWNRRWWQHGKIVVLAFSDTEEAVVKRLLDSLVLTAQEFQITELPAATPLTVGALTLDPQEYKIEQDGRSRSLGCYQFAILHLLARNPGRTFAKEQIYTHVWDEFAPINVDETIRYHIGEIRKALRELTGRDGIETVWGIGYRFNNIRAEK